MAIIMQQSEVHRIIDANGNQMSGTGYPSSNVFTNELKCKRNVNRLNADMWWHGQGNRPFSMQTAVLNWEDRNGIS